MIIISVKRRLPAVLRVLTAALIIFALTGAKSAAGAEAAKPFRVVDASDLAALPDIIPTLSGWAPPLPAQPVYSVYQDEKPLGKYTLLTSAIDYAQRYARSVVVAEGLLYYEGAQTAAPAANKGAFAVYQQSKLLRVYGDYRSARAYADLWDNSRITGFMIIWHNCGAVSGARLLALPYEKAFAAFDEAVKYAKASGLPRPAVISNAVLWELTPPKNNEIEGVALIDQMPELARGCEVTSLAMMLNYLGVNADKMTLAKQIRKSPYTYDDPNNGFVGDIYTFSKHGLGVYHGPIAELAAKYLPWRVVDATGVDFEDLLYYIDNNRPVLVITNSRFKRLAASDFVTWQIQGGSRIKITYREHAVLITGYDDNNVYMRDPLNGAESAPREAFIEAWEQMGKQAVTIIP